jgi:hypothetical protein
MKLKIVISVIMLFLVIPNASANPQNNREIISQGDWIVVDELGLAYNSANFTESWNSSDNWQNQWIDRIWIDNTEYLLITNETCENTWESEINVYSIEVLVDVEKRIPQADLDRLLELWNMSEAPSAEIIWIFIKNQVSKLLHIGFNLYVESWSSSYNYTRSGQLYDLNGNIAEGLAKPEWLNWTDENFVGEYSNKHLGYEIQQHIPILTSGVIPSFVGISLRFKGLAYWEDQNNNDILDIQYENIENEKYDHVEQIINETEMTGHFAIEEYDSIDILLPEIDISEKTINLGVEFDNIIGNKVNVSEYGIVDNFNPDLRGNSISFENMKHEFKIDLNDDGFNMKQTFELGKANETIEESLAMIQELGLQSGTLSLKNETESNIDTASDREYKRSSSKTHSIEGDFFNYSWENETYLQGEDSHALLGNLLPVGSYSHSSPTESSTSDQYIVCLSFKNYDSSKSLYFDPTFTLFFGDTSPFAVITALIAFLGVFTITVVILMTIKTRTRYNDNRLINKKEFKACDKKGKSKSSVNDCVDRKLSMKKKEK